MIPRFARLGIGLIASLLSVLVLVAAALSTAAAQGPDDWTAPYRPAMRPQFADDLARFPNLPRYDLDLRLAVTEEAATLSGHETVFYTNRAALSLNTIVFRLFPNLDSYGGALEVANVTLGGVPVTTSQDVTGSVLTLALPTPIRPGEQVKLDLDFTTTVTADEWALYGQFSYLDGLLALPQAYPLLSVYEPGRGWWLVAEQPQGDAVFSESAFFDVRITAPASLILAASGSLVDLKANDDGTLTHRYVAPLMRDFALFASPSLVTVSGEQDGVRLNLYFDPATPGGDTAARAGLQMLRDAVRVFNAAYGAYPFIELDVVQTGTTNGGLEYPGIFAVGRDIWNQDDEFFEFIIVHETAHQWWYSLVGSDPALDPWLDEALAQYSVAVYIRDREGPAAYRQALDAFQAQVTGYTADHADQVIGLPVTAYPGMAYFYMIYQKGPLFFGALEAEYGYETVLRLLQDYLTAHRYRTVRPRDMLRSFENTLGTDLAPLFADWIGLEIAPEPVG
jgi:aminopeptidase N